MRPTRLCCFDCFGAAAVLIAVAASIFSAPVEAGDPASGRNKATQCQTCHGMDGMAKLPIAPHLAGQNEVYLVKTLKDYRTGARRDDMMSLVIRELSDQDILDLAAYYGRIEVKVKAP